MTTDEKRARCEDLVQDFTRAERVTLFADLGDRVPDSASLRAEGQELVVEALRHYAAHLAAPPSPAADRPRPDPADRHDLGSPVG